MINKREKGFTLVELLAVIVILAIVLVIAVPKVMSVIEDSKKATLESTAKMIASSAEKQKVQNTVLGNTDEITCDSVAKINKLDYASCSITFDNNTAKVTIKGSGKFAGLYICDGDKTTSTATTEECASNTLVAHIKKLFNDETTKLDNGLVKDNTVDQNIRYSGSNDVVKNYVEFGNTNELWRIIGIFKMTTSSGKTEELVKIVREDSVGHIAYDTSESTINSGYGINQWGESGDYLGADLMQLLNGNYLSKQDAESACAIFDEDGDYEFGTCNFSSTGISSTYKSKIETVVWNIGAWDGTDTAIANFENSNLDIVKLYDVERGTLGKICSETNEDGSENTACNDTIERTTTWEGLVALPYPTDYGYASSESRCYTNMWEGLDKSTYTTLCKNNNWMHYGIKTGFNIDEVMWFLTPYASSGGAIRVSSVYGGGFADSNRGYNPLRVRPTLYLNANVSIDDGIGTSGSPYILKLS